MPGGRRNPLSVSRIVEAVQNVKNNAHDVASVTKSLTKAKLGEIPFVDIQIQFIGASGLPRMDVVGTADPYFVANVDDQISFVSTVISNSLKPVWNEVWRINNVPADASLSVEVLDKDDGAPHDDYIGKFKTTISPGAKEAEIEGPLFRRDRGTFWLKIESTPSTSPHPLRFPYLFDGPIRFSRHFSPTVGLLTNIPSEDDARLYSTWKMYLKGVPLFFGNTYQPWNTHYKAAQSIFQGPASIAVRSGIQAGHRMLYARTARNGFGVITDAADIQEILHGGRSTRPAGGSQDTNANTNSNTNSSGNAGGNAGGSGGSAQTQYAHRIKPAVYTYIISADDDSFRFSETGAAFFVDFASKHALHSNCAPSVRYSGEFHPRPQGGWAAFTDTLQDNQVAWELVIDNNSGTYAPDPGMLPRLKELLEYNFPGLGIVALDHGEGELERSREACRAYALEFRGVRREELQPHAGEGESTLLSAASAQLGGGGVGRLGIS